MVTWLSTTEVARKLGVWPSTVRWRCERGYIPGAHKCGMKWLIPATYLERPFYRYERFYSENDA